MNCTQCGALLDANARFCSRCGTQVVASPLPRIQIPRHIADRAANFTGRSWVLDDVYDWIDARPDRFLLLTGEPGIGKTALAAWLVGAGPIPDGDDDQQQESIPDDVVRKREVARQRLESIRHSWSAVHFCTAEDQRGSLEPTRFAQSLARQLSERYDDYAEAVLERVAPDVVITQDVRVNRGRMIGAQIDKLIINTAAEEIYNWVVREPLETLFDRRPDHRIFILIDSLDESLALRRHPTILTLLAGSNDLPPGVRFLVTSRNDPRVTDTFHRYPRIDLSSADHSGHADRDIRAYVEQRMRSQEIADRINDGGSVDIDLLVKRASGNFLYISLLLDEVAQGQRSLANLDDLPKDLRFLYRDFLDRIMPEMRELGDYRRWEERYKPILGTISVAMPAAPSTVLPGWAGLEPGETVGILNNTLAQITEYDPAVPGSYRLYHRSLADFLARARLQDNGASSPNRYYTPPRDEHERIITYYLNRYKNAWHDCDPYGLRQLVSHLQTQVQTASDRAGRIEQSRRLYDTVLDESFRLAQRDTLRDIHTTLSDLRTALDMALSQDQIDLVAVLRCAGAYRETIQTESIAQSIFDAVDASDVGAALQRTTHYGVTGGPTVARSGWERVLLAYLAWEAAETGNAEAVRAAVQLAGLPSGTRADQLHDALVTRASRSFAERSGDPRDAAGVLAELIPTEDAESLLVRYRLAEPILGSDRDRMFSELDDRLQELEDLVAAGDSEGVSMVPFIDAEYVATETATLQDRLLAVAADPAGEARIDHAIDLVLTNPYPHYRDISLVALGIACAAVPSADQVRRRIRTILRTALDREGMTFTFDLPAVLLTEARRRGTNADGIAAYIEKTQSDRDRWGVSLRALSALAAARFRESPDSSAIQELETAAREYVTFAGYAVLHRLSLANRWWEFGMSERIRMPVWEGDGWSLLHFAEHSAHEVRDPALSEMRLHLVQDYITWSDQPVADHDSVRSKLASMTDPDFRRTYLDHVTARWASRETRDLDGLKGVVPLALTDATTLDTTLGRLVGVQVQELDPADLAAAIEICEAHFCTSRPWEMERWY